MLDKIFIFSEEHTRLFQVEENQFIIIDFDVLAVSNNYGIELIEAMEKIAEYHNIPIENMDMLCESLWQYTTIQQIDTVIAQTERSIEQNESTGNASKVKMLTASLGKLKERRKEIENDKKSKTA
jgi:hypothetical protein